MRSNKRFTNTTFTKRVDHMGGEHRPSRAIAEPAGCSECGAIYTKRRWTAPGPSSQSNPQSRKQGKWRPSQLVVCPACKQKNEDQPRGFVFLDGDFFPTHREEIESLLRNEAQRAADDNVLARIIDFKEGKGHKLTIATTTEHLAQRLGHALEKAFGGDVQYDFSHENKLARVSWRR
jgi:hypothetical protein